MAPAGSAHRGQPRTYSAPSRWRPSRPVVEGARGATPSWRPTAQHMRRSRESRSLNGGITGPSFHPAIPPHPAHPPPTGPRSHGPSEPRSPRTTHSSPSSSETHRGSSPLPHLDRRCSTVALHRQPTAHHMRRSRESPDMNGQDHESELRPCDPAAPGAPTTDRATLPRLQPIPTTADTPSPQRRVQRGPERVEARPAVQASKAPAPKAQVSRPERRDQGGLDPAAPKAPPINTAPAGPTGNRARTMAPCVQRR